VLADSEHVEVLRRGPRSWNDWRRQNPTTVPNLIRLSLSAAERQMGTVNGGPVNLASARLRGASLRFATLSGANLAGADLSGADLTDARLDGANLTDADLSHTLLNRTDFAGAKLVGARLEGTNLALARNLTQDQIMESPCDHFTLLPQHLEPPMSWTEASDAEAQLDDDHSAHVPNVAARGRGGTMSWLVGGGPPVPAVPKLK
jgi:Pentapeptide repeats (8 copies)